MEKFSWSRSQFVMNCTILEKTNGAQQSRQMLRSWARPFCPTMTKAPTPLSQSSRMNSIKSSTGARLKVSAVVCPPKSMNPTKPNRTNCPKAGDSKKFNTLRRYVHCTNKHSSTTIAYEMIYPFWITHTQPKATSTAITINILTLFFFSLHHGWFCRGFNIPWHPHANQCIQMKQVSASLQPGTAMNVTLVGNYTKSEGPYKAKLKSYYADTNETKTRDIEPNVSVEKILQNIFNVKHFWILRTNNNNDRGNNIKLKNIARAESAFLERANLYVSNGVYIAGILCD